MARLEGIKACVFDAYGTLFDVHAPVERLADEGEKATTGRANPAVRGNARSIAVTVGVPGRRRWLPGQLEVGAGRECVPVAESK